MKFWLVVLGLTALLVAGSVALAGNNEPTTNRKPVPGAEVARQQPVVSHTLPANGLIAASFKGAIVLVDPATGKMTKVPGSPGMDKPAWSPDARVLAVEKGTSVYTIRPDGSHAQLVLKDASSPSWSEDGTRIFAERDTCSSGDCATGDVETTVVYSAAPDGSDAHPIGDEDVYDPSQAGWPPASHVLSFLEDESSSAPTPVEVDSSQASWSPDGFELAFADASTGLWIVSVDGGQPELVAAGPYSSPSWGNATAPAARSARR